MLPYTLLIIIIVTIIIVTMIENNAFGFNKCYFGIRSGFKKNIFPNSVKNEIHIGYLNLNSTS